MVRPSNTKGCGNVQDVDPSAAPKAVSDRLLAKHPAEALRVSRDRLQQLGAGGLGRGSAEAQGQIGGMMADLQAGAAAMAACGGVWEARCVIVW